MGVRPEASFTDKERVCERVGWDFQSALGALAATAARDIPDHLLMTLLAAAVDRETLNRLFQEVFDRYHERVGRWCYRVTRNKDRSLDLTQEVFLKAFRSLHTFRGDSQLSTWLYVITRNHCLNSLKKWKTEPDDNVAESPRVLQRMTADDAHAALERAQSYQQVYRYMSSILTPMEVRVMTLHYVHEFTLPVITRRLMLSNRSGAKAYIVSARRKFSVLAQDYSQHRAMLSDYAGEMLKRPAAA
jgi:RNA polymerase sigma-70 factor (ECF subfamily)